MLEHCVKRRIIGKYRWECNIGGDTAHAMTMRKPLPPYPIPIFLFPLCSTRHINTEAQITIVRGEGASHGSTGIAFLLDNLLLSLRHVSSPLPSLRDFVDNFERDMIRRTAPALPASRRACLYTHNYPEIDNQSPLVFRRAMVMVEEAKAQGNLRDV